MLILDIPCAVGKVSPATSNIHDQNLLDLMALVHGDHVLTTGEHTARTPPLFNQPEPYHDTITNNIPGACRGLCHNAGRLCG